MKNRIMIGIFFSLPVLLAVSCHTYKGGLSDKIPERNKIVNKDSTTLKKDSLKVVYSPCAGWGKGEDSAKAAVVYNNYKKFFDAGDYKSAIPYWKDFVKNHGGARQTPYSDGSKMYEELAKAETDPGKRKLLVDTLLQVYDKWMYCYPDRKGELLGYKAVKMYNNKVDIMKVWKTFNEAITITGNSTKAVFLYPYMVTAIQVYKMDSLSLEDLVDRYGTISSIMDKSPSTDIPATRDKIEAAVKNIITCEAISKIHKKWYADHPGDKEVLDRIIRQETLVGCTNDSLYALVLKDLQNKKPTARNAYFLGHADLNKGNFDEAINYFKEAIHLDTSQDITADCDLQIAEAYRAMKDNSSSCDYALKASAIQKDWGEPYILIAKLYAASMEDCKPGSALQGKEVYWAAIDLLNKAKSLDAESAESANQLITVYAESMPTEKECVSLGLTDGSDYKVGCWINTNTKVRFAK